MAVFRISKAYLTQTRKIRKNNKSRTRKWHLSKLKKLVKRRCKILYIFQYWSLVEFNKLFPQYPIHFINITRVCPIWIMNPCNQAFIYKTWIPNKNRKTNNIYDCVCQLYKPVSTCEVQPCFFTSNCSHHHVRTIKRVNKIWGKSCSLSFSHDLC